MSACKHHNRAKPIVLVSLSNLYTACDMCQTHSIQRSSTAQVDQGLQQAGVSCHGAGSDAQTAPEDTSGSKAQSGSKSFVGRACCIITKRLSENLQEMSKPGT